MVTERTSTEEELQRTMKHEPVHQAQPNDEAPTARLQCISEESEGDDSPEGSDGQPSTRRIRARPVISVDGYTSFSIGFTKNT